MPCHAMSHIMSFQRDSLIEGVDDGRARRNLRDARLLGAVRRQRRRRAEFRAQDLDERDCLGARRVAVEERLVPLGVNVM